MGTAMLVLSIWTQHTNRAVKAERGLRERTNTATYFAWEAWR